MKIAVLIVSGFITALLMTAAPSAQAQSTDHVCTTTGQQPDIIAARVELQQAPDALALRLKLGDLLLNAGCYHEAVDVLEAAEVLHPRDPEVQHRLTYARSMLREKVYFEGMDQAEATAELRRRQFRCTQLDDLQACDDAQTGAPGNVDVALAKGGALLKANRIDDAIAVYTRGLQFAPGNALLASSLQSARSRRQALTQKCADEDGEPALQACQAVLIKGSANEFEVTLRIALLQQSVHQPAAALDSYIAANALQPGNRSVALAILALLDSTQRQDALALLARGSSLTTLGRAGEALAGLRQAAALAPGLPDIQKQLAVAEAQARVGDPAQADTATLEDARMAVGRRVVAPTPTPVGVSERVSVPHPSYSNDEPATRSN